MTSKAYTPPIRKDSDKTKLRKIAAAQKRARKAKP